MRITGHWGDEPVCWSWRPPDEADLEAARFDRDSPDEGYEWGSRDHALHYLLNWCRERCAVCGDGSPGRCLHMDHDHSTWWCRGVLCYRCNQTEGYGGGPLFDKYRERNPASILGVKVRWQPNLGPIPVLALGLLWDALELQDPQSRGWRSREGRHWLKYELDLARRDDLTDEEIAKILGRSLGAVSRRRREIGAAFWVPQDADSEAVA